MPFSGLINKQHFKTRGLEERVVWAVIISHDLCLALKRWGCLVSVRTVLRVCASCTFSVFVFVPHSIHPATFLPLLFPSLVPSLYFFLPTSDPLIVYPPFLPPPLPLSVFLSVCWQRGAAATGCKSRHHGNTSRSVVVEAFCQEAGGCKWMLHPLRAGAAPRGGGAGGGSDNQILNSADTEFLLCPSVHPLHSSTSCIHTVFTLKLLYYTDVSVSIIRSLSYGHY